MGCKKKSHTLRDDFVENCVTVKESYLGESLGLLRSAVYNSEQVQIFLSRSREMQDVWSVKWCPSYDWQVWI